MRRNIKKEKKFIFGQYFTKKDIVERVVNLLLEYKNYIPINKEIKILEPSFGTGNFIEVLKRLGFNKIEGCEIDQQLTDKPSDFFKLDLNRKFDLIIGNPPFTKYNIKESYYYPKKYMLTEINPNKYIPNKLSNKEKIQIENAFILKSIKHLKNKNSSIAFVLPISFFIKNKNKDIKKEIEKNFSTIIIFQNDKNWFDEPIPCCFAIFTNTEHLKDKIILLYEDDKNVHEILDKSNLLSEELIPKSFLYKKNNHQKGTPLSEFLSEKAVKYKLSYKGNNVSGSNITERTHIPSDKNVSDYSLAVVRVGNVSVGKAGLIEVKKDILNGMFYVFDFKEKHNNNKKIKEKICELLNANQKHFRNLTYRVGSKSLKKSDILEFKII